MCVVVVVAVNTDYFPLRLENRVGSAMFSTLHPTITVVYLNPLYFIILMAMQLNNIMYHYKLASL